MTDPFRADYRELSEAEKKQIKDLKIGASLLLTSIQAMPDIREKYLAITKLEESIMWAVKGVTAGPAT